MKNMFIDEIAEAQNFAKKDVECILKEFFKQFREHCREMEPDEEFLIKGYFKVQAQTRKKKTGRNPKTGAIHTLPPAKNIKIKVTPAFFAYVNSEELYDDRFEED